MAEKVAFWFLRCALGLLKSPLFWGMIFFIQFIFLISIIRLERTALHNGLELGRKYPWEGVYDNYLWTKKGDLISPHPVEFLCFNDRYIAASGYHKDTSFIYDIEKQEISFSDEKEYHLKNTASGLYKIGIGCTGYTNFSAGANLFIWGYLKNAFCTLKKPCEARRQHKD